MDRLMDERKLIRYLGLVRTSLVITLKNEVNSADGSDCDLLVTFLNQKPEEFELYFKWRQLKWLAPGEINTNEVQNGDCFQVTVNGEVRSYLHGIGSYSWAQFYPWDQVIIPPLDAVTFPVQVIREPRRLIIGKKDFPVSQEESASLTFGFYSIRSEPIILPPLIENG